MSSAERFFFEDAQGDFPYYGGGAVKLSARQWLCILAALAAGFLALTVPLPGLSAGWRQLAGAILFAGLPMLALARCLPGHWRALMGKVGLRELGLMLGFAFLSIVTSGLTALAVSMIFDVVSNPIVDRMSHLSDGELGTLLLKTIPQLFGEELLTILPFLGLLHVFHDRAGWSRKQAILAAWLSSSLVFGAAHLPTYGWHLVQCFIVIGSARLVLTLAYLKTKNIWVSTGAHIVNDWTLFAIALLAGNISSL